MVRGVVAQGPGAGPYCQIGLADQVGDGAQRDGVEAIGLPAALPAGSTVVVAPKGKIRIAGSGIASVCDVTVADLGGELVEGDTVMGGGMSEELGQHGGLGLGDRKRRSRGCNRHRS